MNTKAIQVLIADAHAVTYVGIRAILEREPGIEIVGEARSGADVPYVDHRTLSRYSALRPLTYLGDRLLAALLSSPPRVLRHRVITDSRCFEQAGLTPA
jgi:hypothetical protein